MEHAEEANPVGDESAYVGVWAKPTPPHMPFSFLPVAFSAACKRALSRVEGSDPPGGNGPLRLQTHGGT
jgi:hypothetical protein